MPTDQHIDPEFESVLAAVNSLEQCALEHENQETRAETGPCYGNRCLLAAMVMDRLDLTVDDLGTVARHLLDFEMEREMNEALPPDPVLDADVIQ